MARSMPAPWLLQTLRDILEGNGESGNRNLRNNRLLAPRVVQIVSYNLKSKSVEISDKEHSVQIFLTKKCFDEINDLHGLESLRYCQVKIDKYHFSTVIQAGGHNDMNLLREMKISFPFALQCSKLTYMGANDCALIGEPIDLNSDVITRNMVKNVDTYITMTSKLISRQFPVAKFPGIPRLPDQNGKFSSYQLFSDNSPPEWHHNFAPVWQKLILDSRLPKEIVQIPNLIHSSQRTQHNTHPSRQKRAPSQSASQQLTQKEAEEMSQMCYGDSWIERDEPHNDDPRDENIEQTQTNFSQIDALSLLRRYSSTQQNSNSQLNDTPADKRDKADDDDEVYSTGGFSPMLLDSSDEDDNDDKNAKEIPKKDTNGANDVDSDEESEQVQFLGEYHPDDGSVNQFLSKLIKSEAPLTSVTSKSVSINVLDSQISPLSQHSRSGNKDESATSVPQEFNNQSQVVATTQDSVDSFHSCHSHIIQQNSQRSPEFMGSTSPISQKVQELHRKLLRAASVVESQLSQRFEESQSHDKTQQEMNYQIDSQLHTQSINNVSQSVPNFFTQFASQQGGEILSQADIVDMETWLASLQGSLLPNNGVQFSNSTASSASQQQVVTSSSQQVVPSISSASVAVETNVSRGTPPPLVEVNAVVESILMKDNVLQHYDSTNGTKNKSVGSPVIAQSQSYSSYNGESVSQSQQVVLINDNKSVKNEIIMQSKRRNNNRNTSVNVDNGTTTAATSVLKTSEREETVTTSADSDFDPHLFIGQTMRKHFVGHGTFFGTVISYDTPFFMVEYSDGDREEMKLEQLKELLWTNATESTTETTRTSAQLTVDSRPGDGGVHDEEVFTQPQYSVHSDTEGERVRIRGVAVNAVQQKGQLSVTKTSSTVKRIKKEIKRDDESAEQYNKRIDALLTTSPALSAVSSSAIPSTTSKLPPVVKLGGNSVAFTIQQRQASSDIAATSSSIVGNGTTIITGNGKRKHETLAKGTVNDIVHKSPVVNHPDNIDSFLDNELAFLSYIRAIPEIVFPAVLANTNTGSSSKKSKHSTNIPPVHESNNEFIDGMLEFILSNA